MTANGTTKDVLYEGQSKTSDLPTSGNPVTYYNGRDYHFDWSKGRQLTEAVVGGQTVKYAYDMAGVRSSKQVGDTTYSYATLSGKVMRQAWGDNNALEFVYDDSSQPFAVIYKHGSAAELYYYLVNAQGDVAAILDSSGTMVAFYDYDAWGNCTVYNSSAKVLTDPTSIANINPLRYRGYYYDAETVFYYLQSRYYDPAICRFINADTFAPLMPTASSAPICSHIVRITRSCGRMNPASSLTLLLAQLLEQHSVPFPPPLRAPVFGAAL